DKKGISMNANALQELIVKYEGRLSRISETEAEVVVGSQWTRKQVMGHLIDSAANNHQRFVRLQQGNLIGFPGYEQVQWVAAGDYSRNTWANLVALWTQYNRQLVIVIEHIDQRCASNVWEEKSLTLESIINDYARHVQHHLEQLNVK
ncbi:MAG TPA: DinB family protein, partial [Bacteroidota bacterium]|nr:DinB family protein [Bacteroidota bacterium]